ncbi:MAG: PilZ domain-containing protein [Nitrospirae bacterium]|nr:PilZ domain-containing protein [Nitrospirota bacterium]
MEKRPAKRELKRLFVRFGMELPTYVGYTTDISATGLFIKSSTIFPPQTVLKIALTLPDERVVFLSGVVMWSKRVPPQLARLVRKNGMGVRLQQPAQNYLELFAAGVAQGRQEHEEHETD